MNNDGKMIAEGVLSGVANMAPHIQTIVNGAMGEELHMAPVHHTQPQHLDAEKKKAIVDALVKAADHGVNVAKGVQ